jgi:hypothetical protein
MVIITNIYKPIEGTRKMVASFERHGFEVAVNTIPTGNGAILRGLYECYKRAIGGHELFTYADAADTYCQRPFSPPTDYLLWSTEKACYPNTERAKDYKFAGRLKSPWRYLNNGVYGGPLALVIEFFERYGLHKLHDGANGQAEVMDAYLQAVKDGFPIKLDFNGELFQSIAFDHDPKRQGHPIHANGYEGTDFEIKGGLVVNRLTGKTPAILHGNGRTPMEWIYDLGK